MEKLRTAGLLDKVAFGALVAFWGGIVFVTAMNAYIPVFARFGVCLFFAVCCAICVSDFLYRLPVGGKG